MLLYILSHLISIISREFPPTTPQRDCNAERIRERNMQVMESPQGRRTPRPISLNLAPQDPPAQDANNADPFVEVDMNGHGL